MLAVIALVALCFGLYLGWLHVLCIRVDIAGASVKDWLGDVTLAVGILSVVITSAVALFGG